MELSLSTIGKVAEALLGIRRLKSDCLDSFLRGANIGRKWERRGVQVP